MLGSETPRRSGCSAMYDKDDVVVWKPLEGAPKPNEGEPEAAKAARALEACDLNFLLMLPWPAAGEDECEKRERPRIVNPPKDFLCPPRVPSNF